MFTVADLRMALEGLPDDQPVKVVTDPGGPLTDVWQMAGETFYVDPRSGPDAMLGPIFLLRAGPAPAALETVYHWAPVNLPTPDQAGR